MLLRHLQIRLTKNRLKPMKMGAKVAVPKVLLDASFFFIFFSRQEQFFGIRSMSQHLHKS